MAYPHEEADSLSGQGANRWVILAVGVGFFVLTWPIWRWLWGEWMANDYYLSLIHI